MIDGNYILVNGSFVQSSEYRISVLESEGFLFSEKIRAIRTSFPFFAESLEMINLKLLTFDQSFPEYTENDGAGLKRQMERTLTRNKHFMGALLSIRFWVSEQKIQYSIQCAKTESIGYELNTKGLYVDVFQKIKKSVSSLSNISLGSEVLWKIAENHLKDNPIDQFLLINTEDQIIEAIGSNVYLIKGTAVKGASINQGAYTDVTKPLMLKIFDSLEFSYSESNGITEYDLKEADEVLLVNAIDGIKWVIGFEGKRYFYNKIKDINNLFVSSLIS